MGKHRGATILIGVIAGFICFFICVFFVTPQLSLIFGVFTASLYMIALGIMNDIYFSKYKHDECCIEDDILLMDNANYYLNKLVCNGMLYLTKSELVFISREKKDSIKVDVPLHSIDIVSYRKIYRHIAGLAITLYDGTKLGFAVSHPENYIERISMLIDSFSSKQ